MKQENRSFFTAAFTGTFFLLCTVILFSLLYLRPGQLDPEEALAPGDFVWVDITGAQEYDLTGKARNKGETP